MPQSAEQASMKHHLKDTKANNNLKNYKTLENTQYSLKTTKTITKSKSAVHETQSRMASTSL